MGRNNIQLAYEIEDMIKKYNKKPEKKVKRKDIVNMLQNAEIIMAVREMCIRDRERRTVAFDGDGIYNIVSGDIIRISVADETTEIAKLDESSFLQAVKDKLR